MAETENKKSVTQIMTDGWNNILSGLAGGKAKNPGVGFTTTSLLSAGILQNLYVLDGFGRKIIDKIAKDQTREWIKINGDPNDTILTQLNTLKAKSKFANLIRWAKLYGGAIIIMGINDGGDLNEPVNENRIRSVDWLTVLDRTFVQLPTENFYDNPASASFGDPEFYTISVTLDNTKRGLLNFKKNQSSLVKIHESRILRMDGVELPLSIREANNSWGDSIFTAAFKQLSNLGQAYEYSAEYIHRMVQDVFKIKNLSALLQRGKEGEDAVKARLNAISKCKSWFNAMILDNEEEYTETSTPLQGLTDVQNGFILALCAAIDMPEVILMGRTPSGLNASGDVDLTSWYNTVKSEQTDNLHPILHRLVSLIIKSREMPSDVRKLATSEWDVIFKSLEQPNEVEEAEIKNKTALTDETYIRTGVLQPAEVAASRFGGGNYSTETQLQELPEDEPIEPADKPDTTSPSETNIPNSSSNNATNG